MELKVLPAHSQILGQTKGPYFKNNNKKKTPKPHSLTLSLPLRLSSSSLSLSLLTASCCGKVLSLTYTQIYLFWHRFCV